MPLRAASAYDARVFCNVAVCLALRNTPREQFDYVFRLAYGRALRLAEWQETQACIQQTRASLSATNTPAEQINRAALASYLRVVLSSNEFLYVD